MKRYISGLFFLLTGLFSCFKKKPEGVINLYRISDELYRSGQPDAEGFTELEQMGIRTVLNLRELHKDPRKARHTRLILMA